MNTGDEIKIGDNTYIVVRVREFEHNKQPRKSLTLKKPNGKRMFNAILYETGQISDVVAIV